MGMTYHNLPDTNSAVKFDSRQEFLPIRVLDVYLDLSFPVGGSGVLFFLTFLFIKCIPLISNTPHSHYFLKKGHWVLMIL